MGGILYTENIMYKLLHQEVLVLDLFFTCLHKGRHNGTVVSSVASQQEGSGFKSELRRFCAEFACSPHVRVGLLRLLRFPPTVQKHVSWGSVDWWL